MISVGTEYPRHQCNLDEAPAASRERIEKPMQKLCAAAFSVLIMFLQ